MFLLKIVDVFQAVITLFFNSDQCITSRRNDRIKYLYKVSIRNIFLLQKKNKSVQQNEAFDKRGKQGAKLIKRIKMLTMLEIETFESGKDFRLRNFKSKVQFFQSFPDVIDKVLRLGRDSSDLGPVLDFFAVTYGAIKFNQICRSSFVGVNL